MMTIKQVLSTGYEIVFEAKRVNYQRANVEQSGLETLFVENPDGTESHIFMTGVYYVMNSSGKTVAKYDLGPEPQS